MPCVEGAGSSSAMFRFQTRPDPGGGEERKTKPLFEDNKKGWCHRGLVPSRDAAQPGKTAISTRPLRAAKQTSKPGRPCPVAEWHSHVREHQPSPGGLPKRYDTTECCIALDGVAHLSRTPESIDSILSIPSSPLDIGRQQGKKHGAFSRSYIRTSFGLASAEPPSSSGSSPTHPWMIPCSRDRRSVALAVSLPSS